MQPMRQDKQYGPKNEYESVFTYIHSYYNTSINMRNIIIFYSLSVFAILCHGQGPGIQTFIATGYSNELFTFDLLTETGEIIYRANQVRTDNKMEMRLIPSSQVIARGNHFMKCNGAFLMHFSSQNNFRFIAVLLQLKILLYFNCTIYQT